jgi:hypothetical protein
MESRFGHSFGNVSVAPSVELTRPDDPSERQADAMADDVLSGRASSPNTFDFSHVRLHRGERAAAATKAVHARAFTVGHDIVLGAGQHDDDRLLAHELVHVVQQRSGRQSLQREIVIEAAEDEDDPAHDMPADRQRDIVGDLVHSLCPGFEVPQSSPLTVEPIGSVCDDIQNEISAGPNTGCCCLCVLTAPGAAKWTIVISQNESPNTSGNTVTINPTDSPVESMHWTDKSGAGERMVHRPRVITFGHELCGHAALMEIGSHPGAGDRETSDVHDPTIKIERLIWGEQGLPAADQRGLAGGSVHRGESVYRITLEKFPSNKSDVASLPTSEKDKLAELKRFSSQRAWFMEVHGHSDHKGTATVRQQISDDRATNVRDDLAASPNGSNYTFVKVEGHSDSQAPAGLSADRLRRAEVILSLFTAGVPTPPATPKGVTNILPGTPKEHAKNLKSKDVCRRHLATEAWR